jgi:hypothetical protein
VQPNTTTPFPAYQQVDYVRIWKPFLIWFVGTVGRLALPR